MRRSALGSPLPRHSIKRFHLDSSYNNDLASPQGNVALDSPVYHPHIGTNLTGSFQNVTGEPCDRKYNLLNPMLIAWGPL